MFSSVSVVLKSINEREEVMASSKPSPFSSVPVLPPIVTNERDRLFLAGLNEWIETELSRIDDQDTEQRYTVYKEAFTKVRVVFLSA
jgi:hypothetical protein